jgi:hypothetical protein
VSGEAVTLTSAEEAIKDKGLILILKESAKSSLSGGRSGAT